MNNTSVTFKAYSDGVLGLKEQFGLTVDEVGDISRVKYIVSYSGGRDSQALISLLLDVFKIEPCEICVAFCDTGWEHSKTYNHVKYIMDNLQLLGCTTTVIRSSKNVPDLIREVGRFPSGAARFCTEQLKIYPSMRYVASVAARRGTGVLSVIGIHGDESKDRSNRYKSKGSVVENLFRYEVFNSKMPKYMYRKYGSMIWLPMLDYSRQEVDEIIATSSNIFLRTVNPLYKDGFNRVGCAPCFMSGQKNIMKYFEMDSEGLDKRYIADELQSATGKSWLTGKSICLICQD